MADPPSVQPGQLGGSVSAPQNPNPLLSAQTSPSPTVSSRQIVHPTAAATGGGSIDLLTQLRGPSSTQGGDGVGGSVRMHRSGPASRTAAPAGGSPPRYAAAAGVYGAQMSFLGGGGGHVGQKVAPRAAMQGKGQLAVLQGQDNAVSAEHSSLRFQPLMAAQPRQKGAVVQGSQSNTANAGHASQQMRSVAAMGMNQMRSSQLPESSQNGAVPYGAQRGFTRAQMRAPQLPGSPQNGDGPYGAQLGFTRSQMRPPQLTGSSQNVQLKQMSPQQKQQEMQSLTASPVPPHHQLQEKRRMLLIQQLQQRGLNQHQIAQGLQEHDQLPHVYAQQLMQQQHQPSPRMSASASPKLAVNSTRSQPGTPLPSGTVVGGSTSNERADGANPLIGKRKIRDFVAEVDPLAEIDPEVEDLILDFADDFMSSALSFASRLAKHRKSSVLDAKDLLLHLERNCHLSVPGFSRERTSMEYR